MTTNPNLEEVIYSLKNMLRNFLGRTVEEDESNAGILTTSMYDLQSLSDRNPV